MDPGQPVVLRPSLLLKITKQTKKQKLEKAYVPQLGEGHRRP